jgi:L-malate glycosyltransferase
MVQRKIKVLVVTHSFPTKYHPIAAIFILNQIMELKPHCDVKVLFPHAYVPKTRLLSRYSKFSQIGDKEHIKGVEVYHPKYFMFPRILFVPKFLSFFLSIESFFSYYFSKKVADKIMEGWNPDIIHIHSSLGEGLIGTRLKRKYKKPMVLTVHGEDITKHSKKLLSGALTKYALRNSDVIICQSKFLENEAKQTGVTDNKYQIIPMGAQKWFKPRDAEEMRKKLDLPRDKKIILFAGYLTPRKGPEYLIKAMDRVLKEKKDTVCYLIGMGVLETELKNMVSSLGLGDNIKFLGVKTNQEVALYMSACDLFVLPSLMEGLPVVLCEALISGKPVVATGIAGTPELVTKDVGYLVKTKDDLDLAKKIIMALDRKWDKKNILERGNEFSTARSAKKLLDVYKKLLKLC